MKRTVKIVVAGAIAAAAIGGGYMAMAGGFDSQKWKAERGNTSHKNPRIGMVADAKTVLRVGMTRAEVIEHLGEPDGDKGRTITYDLGISPFGIDYEYFILEFDELGKLKSWRIMRG